MIKIEEQQKNSGSIIVKSKSLAHEIFVGGSKM